MKCQLDWRLMLRSTSTMHALLARSVLTHGFNCPCILHLHPCNYERLLYVVNSYSSFFFSAFVFSFKYIRCDTHLSVFIKKKTCIAYKKKYTVFCYYEENNLKQLTLVINQRSCERRPMFCLTKALFACKPESVILFQPWNSVFSYIKSAATAINPAEQSQSSSTR